MRSIQVPVDAAFHWIAAVEQQMGAFIIAPNAEVAGLGFLFLVRGEAAVAAHEVDDVQLHHAHQLVEIDLRIVLGAWARLGEWGDTDDKLGHLVLTNDLSRWARLQATVISAIVGDHAVIVYVRIQIDAPERLLAGSDRAHRRPAGAPCGARAEDVLCVARRSAEADGAGQQCGKQSSGSKVSKGVHGE